MLLEKHSGAFPPRSFLAAFSTRDPDSRYSDPPLSCHTAVTRYSRCPSMPSHTPDTPMLLVAKSPNALPIGPSPSSYTPYRLIHTIYVPTPPNHTLPFHDPIPSIIDPSTHLSHFPSRLRLLFRPTPESLHSLRLPTHTRPRPALSMASLTPDFHLHAPDKEAFHQSPQHPITSVSSYCHVICISSSTRESEPLPPLLSLRRNSRYKRPHVFFFFFVGRFPATHRGVPCDKPRKLAR